MNLGGEGQTQLSMMEYLMNDSQGVGVGHLARRRERFLFADEMVLPALASRPIVPLYPSFKISSPFHDTQVTHFSCS